MYMGSLALFRSITTASSAVISPSTTTLAFPSFEGRESFIHALPQIGLAVGVTETAQHPTHPYRVTVRGYSTLLLPDLNRCTARAIREAATHDGILEKIDADFIEKH